jgi:hypothetical protein
MEVSNRVERLKKAVQAETNGACIERPMLWTKYHRNKANSDKDDQRENGRSCALCAQ